MKTLPKASAAFIGTSAMSLFSYAIALLQAKPFREPKNLATLIHRLYPYPAMKTAYVLGWSCHYLVGLLFVELYASFWRHAEVQPNVQNGLVLGGMSGIGAILIWKFTLAMHPDPPSMNFRKYAGHLFLAHLVFGAFAVMGYNFCKGVPVT